MAGDNFEKFKASSREGWSSFQPFETATGTAAPYLVRFSGVQAGQRVLDVGCGTGVVAMTAARLGAKVTGCDLTPALLESARHNAEISGTEVAFEEGDVEALPFAEAAFDVVLSQFGHMFGPRADRSLAEMLRVLKPGGTIAFSTWPPEVYTGRMFRLIGKYAPPPPEGLDPPVLWGEPSVVTERFGDTVRDLTFNRATMFFPTLSPAHMRVFTERHAGPVERLVKALETEPEKLAGFRAEFEELVETYFENNALRQDFLMTRGVKN